ncbi:alpha/beta fold hydrolase [Streptococcus oricebi]|uniref:Alpha/beta hydrolase n=1 Tax=Streptococcus oricebi TaxID=1547447 RepID=A0ABS5B569_9STRE|nr:alpha/beta hydrolase [Streptococcus oricebi]MBP2623998.1 alpha/beta hydrolase [Streptococcus oricebi]
MHSQGTPEYILLPDNRRLYTQVLQPVTKSDVTVVFESGSASTRSIWARVQPKIATFAPAIVYDRAGLGLSDPDPQGRSLTRMAADLNCLLDYFAAPRYILVGHSAGGAIVRLAAAQCPERIVGLVLADPADEADDTLFSPAYRHAERIVLAVHRILAQLHLLPLFYRNLLAALPSDAAADLRHDGMSAAVFSTCIEQSRTFLDQLYTWRNTPPDTGNIPISIISGALPGNGISRNARTRLNVLHRQRAIQSPYGRHVVAPRSGHYVPLDGAEELTDEIIGMIQRKTAKIESRGLASSRQKEEHDLN